MEDIQKYLDLFIDETKEHLQEMNKGLLQLEHTPHEFKFVEIIFRSAHTIKGMAATLAFEKMASLTHEMESVLDALRNHSIVSTSELMSVLFRCVDTLERMLSSIAQGGTDEQPTAALVEALHSFIVDASSVSIGEKEKEGDFPFQELDQSIVQEAIREGRDCYWITVFLREDCVLRSARAFMVFQRLENEGEIIKSVPDIEKIEQEQVEGTTLSFLFLSTKTQDELRQLIEWVSEIDSVVIKKMTLSTHEENRMSNNENEVYQQKQIVHPSLDNKEKGKVAGRKTIRVDQARLDALMNTFSELIIERGRLEQISTDGNYQELQGTTERIARITSDLQVLILNMRMVPIEQVFSRFPRVVRDLSNGLGKQVHLQIEGSETELDRSLVDELGDPLIHLIRNALDHGIESPTQRLNQGKPAFGVLTLRAFQNGNHVFIEVKDDGHGIQREKIIRKAVETGIVVLDQAEKMNDQQIYSLLFHAGFSTADTITDVSGRGVGMDVVKTKVEQLGGKISIDSSPGKGTTFLLELPLSLSILPAMMVEIGIEKYAIPINAIVETAVYKRVTIQHAHQTDVIDFRGRIIPLIPSYQVFNILSWEADPEEVAVVILRYGEKTAGLIVSRFTGQQEVVLKTLGSYLPQVFGISGCTILGDGNVALVIDVATLLA